MKKIFLLLVLLMGVGGLTQAQLPDHLTRNVLAKVNNNEMVDYGQFQVELLKTLDYRETTEGYWFSYLFITRNKYNQQQNLLINGNTLFVKRDLRIRPYRVGNTVEQSVFIIKNMDKNANDIGYRMEQVRAWGIPYMVCDSVVDINDDGFIYKQGGKYSYCAYKASEHDQNVTTPVVWLEKKSFNGNDTGMPAEQKAMFSHLPKGATYYESAEGHYYFLVRDQYMPHTVLVIDNKAVELFGAYTDDNFKLKFSYNGKHWMAVGKECYWVDGTMRSVDGFTITDFVVTNEGHYGYKAKKNDSTLEGEVVVADGQIIRRNAHVSFFGLNAQGKLKFRFLSGGRYLQYEDEKVTDISGFMMSAYYPDNLMNTEPVTVFSNDGLHKLTYQKDVPGVVVDDVKIIESVPCFALYDERNRSFVWNAIEQKGDELELVIYRYSIPNNVFKKIFK